MFALFPKVIRQMVPSEKSTDFWTCHTNHHTRSDILRDLILRWVQWDGPIPLNWFPQPVLFLKATLFVYLVNNMSLLTEEAITGEKSAPCIDDWNPV